MHVISCVSAQYFSKYFQRRAFSKVEVRRFEAQVVVGNLQLLGCKVIWIKREKKLFGDIIKILQRCLALLQVVTCMV